MSKHGKKFCMICNPYGNGSNGREGSEAVGVYYIERTTKDQFQSGNIAVCQSHAEMIEPYFNVDYFDNRRKPDLLTDNTDPRINSGPYEHKWEKMNLVTEEIEGKSVDHQKCSKCGAEFYSTIRNQEPIMGCSIPDEMIK